jgi:phosphoserine aminotransferase
MIFERKCTAMCPQFCAIKRIWQPNRSTTHRQFSWYMCLIWRLLWIEALGIDNLAARNAHKAQLVYDVIDQSGGFYRGHSAVAAR